MSFVVKPVESFKKELVINVPCSENPDTFNESRVTVTWRYLGEDASKALIARVEEARQSFSAQLVKFGKGELEKLPEMSLKDADICRDLVMDIEGLAAPGGADLKYDAAVLVQLMDMTYFKKALTDQMQAVITGRAVQEVLEKN